MILNGFKIVQRNITNVTMIFMSILNKKTNIVWKIFSIILISLILSIITFCLQGLIRDRINYKSKVLSDIGIQWGSPKTILGPAIKIPYQEPIKVISNTGKESYEYQENYLYVLPESLNIKLDLNNKELYRGIYKENVYTSHLNLSGEFKFTEALLKLISEKPNLKIGKAQMVFSINEIKSFKNDLLIAFAGKEQLEFDQSIQKNNNFELSTSKMFLSSLSDLSALSSFNMDLDLNGSRKIEFIPGAKKISVEMKSNWAHPSFSGAYIPSTRNITNKGFEAKWEIFSIVDSYDSLANNSFRPYQEIETDNYYDKSSAFGVDLYSPINIYTKVEKSLKYGFLFVILTFSMYFLIEVLFKQKFHEIQYLMIGLAVSIFYLLLLSLSEHIGFDIAYLIAAFAVTVLIGFYTFSVVEKKKLAYVASSLIALLYCYLYLLLQLTDYSLLFGSFGLFAVLSSIMLVSRKINWYEL